MSDTRYDYLSQGSDIYAESFRIIRAETNLERFPADLESVAVRMVHAAGATDIADDIDFTPGVGKAAWEALAAGASILCDASMVATGIIRSRLPRDNRIICHIQDPTLADDAKRLGITKTAAAIERWRDDMDGAIVAIGNAPTALFRLLEVIAEGGPKPAAVVGMPVGFVGAAESKEALRANPFGLEWVTLRGRRGGSAVTVAALNALASRAEVTNDATPRG
ncbi:MAG: precorrin-8X methylmutase [Propionibacteriaceae bacterium]